MALVEGLNLQADRRANARRIHGLPRARINGLRVARGMLAAEPNAGQVLVYVRVELCTLHFFSGWDPEKIVANSPVR